jgi:hypothetical protein
VGFDDVGDQLPLGQDEAHPLVPLRQGVAGGRHVELEGNAARGMDPLLDPTGKLVQVHVPRVKFGVGIDDGDDRLDLEFLDVHARSRQHGQTGQADGEVLLIENRLTLGFAHVSLLSVAFRYTLSRSTAARTALLQEDEPDPGCRFSAVKRRKQTVP